MNKIKKKIEKLLRLSLSKNDNEANLAAQKAVELMQKYALDNADFSGTKTITKIIKINYARIPIWIRELYNGLSYINGCFMAWKNGKKDDSGKKIKQKAEIFLTGRECDVLNTEYLLHIFIREIERMAEEYKKSLPKGSKKKRSQIASYKIGLGRGLCDRMLQATRTLENSQAGKKLIPIMGDHHERFIKSMQDFSDENRIDYVINEIEEDEDFQKGMEDSKEVDIHKPLDGQDEPLLPSLK